MPEHPLQPAGARGTPSLCWRSRAAEHDAAGSRTPLIASKLTPTGAVRRGTALQKTFAMAASLAPPGSAIRRARCNMWRQGGHSLLAVRGGGTQRCRMLHTLDREQARSYRSCAAGTRAAEDLRNGSFFGATWLRYPARPVAICWSQGAIPYWRSAVAEHNAAGRCIPLIASKLAPTGAMRREPALQETVAVKQPPGLGVAGSMMPRGDADS